MRNHDSLQSVTHAYRRLASIHRRSCFWPLVIAAQRAATEAGLTGGRSADGRLRRDPQRTLRPRARAARHDAVRPRPAKPVRPCDVAALWWQIVLDPENRTLDAQLESAAHARHRRRQRLDRARAAAGRSLVLSRRRLRATRAVAGAPRRATGRGARRQPDPVARSNARSRSIRRCTTRSSASGSTTTTPTSRPRRRRCCAGCCFCPAATAPGAARDARGPRPRASSCRGEADFQLHWLYLWYEHQPQRALRAADGTRSTLSVQPGVPPAHRRSAGRVLPRSSGERAPRGSAARPRACGRDRGRRARTQHARSSVSASSSTRCSKPIARSIHLQSGHRRPADAPAERLGHAHLLLGRCLRSTRRRRALAVAAYTDALGAATSRRLRTTCAPRARAGLRRGDRRCRR